MTEYFQMIRNEERDKLIREMKELLDEKAESKAITKSMKLAKKWVKLKEEKAKEVEGIFDKYDFEEKDLEKVKHIKELKEELLKIKEQLK